MDHNLFEQSNRRRDELLLDASHVRLARLALREPSNSIRSRIADGAQGLSVLLAGFAQAVRDGDAR